MQRWCSKLRSLSLFPLNPVVSFPWPTMARLHHQRSSISSYILHRPFTCPSLPTPVNPHINLLTSRNALCSSVFPHSSVRNFSAKSKEKKWKKLTPATSKVKKIKMKTYSSFKGRFRILNDGHIRRWREGKRHNAHFKSKEAKRRLRKPAIVPLAYAKVMKKLNFCA